MPNNMNLKYPSLASQLLNLRPAGMFSNVNEVVEQLRLADRDGYQFFIDWSKSCYRSHKHAGNPWSYYFEQPFEAAEASPESEVLPTGASVACTRDNIITPRLTDGECNPLLLPLDRQGAHNIICRYLKLKPEVRAGINAFSEANFTTRMIGLHIRGPGRTDGGVPELRTRYGSKSEVPFEVFFKQVDEALRLLPEARIFACTDSESVMMAIQERFGAKIASWPALRSEFGEMHAQHPKNEGQDFDPYQLGLDVLSEAYLLSKCDLLVHGNSNVTNFVLCASPNLMHVYIPA